MVAALSFRPLFGKLLNYSSAIPIPNHPGGLVIESAEENGEKKMRYYILRLESESQYPRLQSKSIITTRVSGKVGGGGGL